MSPPLLASPSLNFILEAVLFGAALHHACRYLLPMALIQCHSPPLLPSPRHLYEPDAQRFGCTGMKTLVDAHTDLCAIDHLAKGVVLVKPSETMRLRCLVKAMLQLRCQAGQKQEPDDGGDAGRLAPMFAAVAAAVAAAEEDAAGATPALAAAGTEEGKEEEAKGKEGHEEVANAEEPPHEETAIAEELPPAAAVTDEEAAAGAVLPSSDGERPADEALSADAAAAAAGGLQQLLGDASEPTLEPAGETGGASVEAEAAVEAESAAASKDAEDQVQVQKAFAAAAAAAAAAVGCLDDDETADGGPVADAASPLQLSVVTIGRAYRHLYGYDFSSGTSSRLESALGLLRDVCTVVKGAVLPPLDGQESRVMEQVCGAGGSRYVGPMCPTGHGGGGSHRQLTDFNDGAGSSLSVGPRAYWVSSIQL